MTSWLHLVLALAFLSGTAIGSADLDTCSDEGCEDPRAMSLLQQEIHLNTDVLDSEKEPKTTQSKTWTEADRVAWEQSKGPMAKGQITTATAMTCVGLAMGFLLLGGIIARVAKDSDGPPGAPKYVAEFVGTFMLIFSVGCNVLVGSATWGVTSIACTLMVSIYALGGVSGANFNPAVSVALGLAGKMKWVEVAIYVCVQFAAGIFAGLSYGLILGQTFNLGPKGMHTLFGAGLSELFYTFMLTFVVLNVAASNAHAGKNQFYGLAIGFSVVAGGYGAGSISGGCFNPAVALGIDASSLALGFGTCLPYMAFEFIGCALAAALFRVCRPEDFGDSEVGLKGKLTSEFLGTFMLVLTVGLNVLNHSKAAAFSIAASLMCMIFALGTVSGAHFNPSVTLAIACSGRNLISKGEALLYVLVQIIAGICAAFTYMALMGGKTVPLNPFPAHSTYQALVGEFIFTFLLSFVVLSVATVKSPLTEYFGLAIGACVIAGGYAIGNISGGSLNPAVSAGLAFSDLYHGGSCTFVFSYAAAELLGGVVAAVIFSFTHVKEYKDPDANANKL